MTVRTVLRDVTALRKSGHEIAGARGRGGGLSLPRRAGAAPELKLIKTGAEREASRTKEHRQAIFVGREARINCRLCRFPDVTAG